MNDGGTIRHYSTSSGCSCPDWLYRHRTPGNPCKHVKRYVAAQDYIEAQNRHNASVSQISRK